MNLLETYRMPLENSKKAYSALHEGAALPSSKQMLVAKLLENVNEGIDSKMSNSVGTQRADLGTWKRFCTTVTSLAVPTLVADELVVIKEMESYAGVFAYVKFTAGSTKGGVKQGDSLNSIFAFGGTDGNYSSEAIVETVEAGEFTPAWTPVLTKVFEDANGEKHDLKLIATDGTVTYADLADGKATVTAGKVCYRYNNQTIPQNDLPLVNMTLDHVTVEAKVRRLANYYSDIAAFQMAKDYSGKMEAELAKQTAGLLKYEIDTEVVQFVDNMAGDADADLKFNRTMRHGVSLAEHYASFAEMIEIGKQKIYDATKRYSPSFILIASDVLPVLNFVPGYKPSGVSANGAYVAGTVNGLKVIVSPNIGAGRFVIGANEKTLECAPAILGTYMPIMPTQLLQGADGAFSRGYSTAYGLAALNKNLVVAGSVVREAWAD